MRRSPTLAVLYLAALTATASASDGVLEINHVCATSPGGCFPGDAQGYPVTITPAAPAHSFRLTSDLATASGQQTMIDISASSVTLDLGGFRIAGPAVCSDVPVSSCTNTGLGVGVRGAHDVTVKNGTITGIGNNAVDLTYSARVEALNVFHCGGGIVATDLAVIRGNIVTSGGGDGIRCRDHCVVSENTATGHYGDGIQVTAGAVNGNAASLNGGSGGNFLGAVSYGQNQFSGNAGGDVAGGHASSGNACADGSCSPRGARRYYLTPGTFIGNQPKSACAAGFHMASLWEIHDVSGLEYDLTRGATNSDSGSGPPTYLSTVGQGWIRTGYSYQPGNGAPGVDNCGTWTSGLSGNGTTAALPGHFPGWNTAPATLVTPWIIGVALCSSPLPVWCVED